MTRTRIFWIFAGIVSLVVSVSPARALSSSPFPSITVTCTASCSGSVPSVSCTGEQCFAIPGGVTCFTCILPGFSGCFWVGSEIATCPEGDDPFGGPDGGI